MFKLQRYSNVIKRDITWISCESACLVVNLIKIYMGLVARKPVFGVSDKASFKTVSSATETS